MRRGTQAAMCPAGRKLKGGSPGFAVMLVPLLRVTAGGPPGLAASAVLTLSPLLLRAASQVAPERKAEEAAEGAAGEEGEDGGAADVLVLLLKGLRQALRDAPYCSGSHLCSLRCTRLRSNRHTRCAAGYEDEAHCNEGVKHRPQEGVDTRQVLLAAGGILIPTLITHLVCMPLFCQAVHRHICLFHACVPHVPKACAHHKRHSMICSRGH